jgi:hypothetical protein
MMSADRVAGVVLLQAFLWLSQGQKLKLSQRHKTTEGQKVRKTGVRRPP